MQQWEYISTPVMWSPETETWAVNHPTRPDERVDGATMGCVLGVYGDLGWELVNLTTEHVDMRKHNTVTVTQWGITTYRAVFKRPKQE